jgi:hypothetical protein
MAASMGRGQCARQTRVCATALHATDLQPKCELSCEEEDADFWLRELLEFADELKSQ